jgi:hypothetical protein
MTERLIVSLKPVSDLRPNRAARFAARLESTGDFVIRSHQPLVDGARELLARGYDPEVLLTMRHEGKAYGSFKPSGRCPVRPLSKLLSSCQAASKTGIAVGVPMKICAKGER